MDLSVVILNYNVKHFVSLCIQSVQKAIVNLNAEIIVVDNASTDGSKEIIETTFPEIKYLYLHENEGFPKGNNIGVEAAQGKYICILNPDTIVAEDTFSILLKMYKELDTPGILGSKLIDGSGTFLPESKRGVPTPWVAFTKILGLYKIFPNSKKFNQYYAQHINENELHKVDILVGAFMFLEKDLYIKVGGFDEGCFMYSDDIDLSYSVLQENKNNYYVPNTTVVHFKGESTLKDGLYMKRFKDAMHFFYKKHFKSSFFLNSIMDLGIFIFAFKKKNTQPKFIKPIESYCLITQNEQLITLMKNKFQALKVFDDLNQINPYKNTLQTEFLIDSEIITYKDYINFLKKNQNTKHTFKIKPQKSNFFIGSNDKNDKGEILDILTK